MSLVSDLMQDFQYYTIILFFFILQGLSQRLAVSWPYFEKGASKTELW